MATLTPRVAIIDAVFTEALPPVVTSDFGIDVLVHATEACTSGYANDLSLQAIRLVFENLERAVANGSDRSRARGCTTPARSPAWPSRTRSRASARHRADRRRASTSRTAAPTASCCRT